jgi:DHA1 family tetracycline resistance protein-like MFS transporter
MQSRSEKGKKFSLFSVYFTFFVDSLSWSIIFPIFAPYFLDPNNPLFSSTTPLAARTTLLGFFLMAFSLGQFLAAPILGEYADKHGRRKALIVSVLFTCVGMLTTALSIKMYSLIFLFLGRLMTGVFASNLSVCLACISDLSITEKIKIKRFSFLSVLTGISFILGAFLGGKLSDASIYPWLSADIPFWLASCLTFLNFLFVIFGFKETSTTKPSLRFHFFESFHNIKKVLETKKIKGIYTVYFLFLCAWTLIFQFIPVLVVHKYAFTNSQIGNLALFMGGFWALGSSVLNKLLISHFSSQRILDWCLALFTLLCAGIVFPSHTYLTLSLLGLCALVGGLAWPHCTNVISNTAPKEVQGKILGLTQSIQSLAMALAPLIGGISYQIVPGSVFLLAAFACLAASLIYTLKNR